MLYAPPSIVPKPKTKSFGSVFAKSKTQADGLVPQFQNAVVDADGNGDYATIEEAEADAVAGWVVWVKAGTYSPGAAVDFATTTTKYIFEAGTVVDTNKLQPTAAKVAFELQPGVDFQVLLDSDGDDFHLSAMNGWDVDGIDCAGARAFVSGGGWGSLSDGGTVREGIYLKGADSSVLNIVAQNTSASAAESRAFDSEGARSGASGLKVVSSDQQGIRFDTGGDGYVLGCFLVDSDFQGISFDGPRTRVLGNNIATGSSDGLHSGGGSADDSVVVGNISETSGDPLVIHADAENVVGVGNKLDGAASDSSGTSTVDANDETAF